MCLRLANVQRSRVAASCEFLLWNGNRQVVEGTFELALRQGSEKQ